MNPTQGSGKVPSEKPIESAKPQEPLKDLIKPAAAGDLYDLDVRVSVSPDPSPELVGSISCTCHQCGNSNFGSCVHSCIGTCAYSACGC